MKQVPDENDIVYNTYGVDIIAIVRWLYDTLIGGDWNEFLNTVQHWWSVFSIIAFIVSLIFFIGFIYAKLRYTELAEHVEEKLLKEEEAWEQKYGGGGTRNNRWEQVKEHVVSDNPNDWRLAIIEADIILEEALEKAGFPGSTIGEKLKSANGTSLRSLQDAWDAHKVRNEIAHSGSDFVLTKKQAQETILQFERVFKEFGVI